MYFYRQTLTKYADIRVKEIAKYEGVYFDMLQQIFTDITGFSLILGRGGGSLFCSHFTDFYSE